MNELYVLDSDCFTLFQFGHEAIVEHAAAVDHLGRPVVSAAVVLLF